MRTSAVSPFWELGHQASPIIPPYILGNTLFLIAKLLLSLPICLQFFCLLFLTLTFCLSLIQDAILYVSFQLYVILLITDFDSHYNYPYKPLRRQ